MEMWGWAIVYGQGWEGLLNSQEAESNYFVIYFSQLHKFQNVHFSSFGLSGFYKSVSINFSRHLYSVHNLLLPFDKGLGPGNMNHCHAQYWFITLI